MSVVRRVEGSGSRSTPRPRPLRRVVPVEPARPTPRVRSDRPAATVEVDCLGMRCPGPVLAVARRAQTLPPEPTLLRVTSDDPDFPLDLRTWCRAAAAELVRLERVEDRHVATIALHGAAEPAPLAELPEPEAAPAPIQVRIPSAPPSSNVTPGLGRERSIPPSAALVMPAPSLRAPEGGARDTR
jgi:TusA-related sulfurtransferase